MSTARRGPLFFLFVARVGAGRRVLAGSAACPARGGHRHAAPGRRPGRCHCPDSDRRLSRPRRRGRRRDVNQSRSRGASRPGLRGGRSFGRIRSHLGKIGRSPRPVRGGSGAPSQSTPPGCVQCAPEHELRQHPTRVAQLRAVEESAGYKLEAARHQLQRQEELLKINNANLQEVRRGRKPGGEQEAQVRAAKERLTELEQSEPQLAVREAKADVTAAEARVRAAEYAVEQCELKRLPPARYCASRQPWARLWADPGSGAVLFCSAGPLIVRAEVEQEFVRRLSVGQKARVADEAAGGPMWTGRITRVAGWYASRRTTSNKPSDFKDVPTVECTIRFDDPTPAVRIGQRVQVAIGG